MGFFEPLRLGVFGVVAMRPGRVAEEPVVSWWEKTAEPCVRARAFELDLDGGAESLII